MQIKIFTSYDCINFTPIEDEVKNSVLKLKDKLTSGPDNIPSFLVRKFVSCLFQY